MIYARIQFPRSGLANRLFVWARAIVFCRQYGAQLLSPQFASFKLGPLFRGESDLRTYHNLFKRHPGEIEGIRKYLLIALCPSGYSDQIDTTQLNRDRSRIIIFRRTKESFREINPHHDFIRNYLLEITKPRWIKLIPKQEEPVIGVHIRLGDYKPRMAHPIGWYIETLRQVRKFTGDVKACIYSDGSFDELLPILGEKNTILVRTGSAISDLIALSQSHLLIGTGSSSFSAWSAYLGQMPVITRVGNSLSWFELENNSGQCIQEWIPGTKCLDVDGILAGFSGQKTN